MSTDNNDADKQAAPNPFRDEGINTKNLGHAKTEAADKPATTIAMRMRWAGTLILLVAAGIFMLQGLSGILPIYRSWVILLLSLLLTAAGGLCGFVLKDVKGARVALGLAIAMLVAQFSQVGSFMLDQFAPDLWGNKALDFMILPTASNIWLSVIATVVTALILSFYGFSVFARRHAKTMTLMFVFLCSFFFIPTRDNDLMSSYLFFATFAAAFFDFRKLQPDSVMSLKEGQIARMLLFSPLFVLLARSFFYPTSSMASAVLFTSVGILFHQPLAKLVEASRKGLAQTLGHLFFLLAWSFLVDGVCSLVPALSPHRLPLGLLPIAFVVAFFPIRVDRGPGFQQIRDFLAMLICCYAIVHGSTLGAAFGAVFGLFMLSQGFRLSGASKVWNGLACTVIGLSYGSYQTFVKLAPSLWIVLTIVGVFILIASSLFEKYGDKILSRFKQLHKDKK